MSQHLSEALKQPFISATALAAGIHSAWSLGTMFSGEMPTPEPTARFIFWIVPAVLIAFAIDIGQISTSAEIRAGQRSNSKYATFVLLALATYYLQFIYIVHHMPALEIAPGVALLPGVAEVVRNAAVWLIPALLPISTILYTLGNEEKQIAKAPSQFLQLVEVLTDEDGEILSGEIPNPPFVVVCPDCGWAQEYDNRTSATNGLNRHRGHCPKNVVLSPNGHHE